MIADFLAAENLDEPADVPLAATPSRTTKRGRFKKAATISAKKAKAESKKAQKPKDTLPKQFIPKDASPASVMYLRMQFELDKEVMAAQMQESERDRSKMGKHPRQKANAKGHKSKGDSLETRDSKGSGRSPSPRGGGKKGKKGKK